MAATRKKPEKKPRTPKGPPRRYEREGPIPEPKRPPVMAFLCDTRLHDFFGRTEKSDWEFALHCCDGDAREAALLVAMYEPTPDALVMYGRTREEAESRFRKKHGLPPKPAKVPPGFPWPDEVRAQQPWPPKPARKPRRKPAKKSRKGATRP